MQHARVKPKARPHQLPGLRGHDMRAATTTTSDNSLSSSDSGGRCRAKSRDRQVPAVTMAASDCKQQSQFLSVADSTTDELRYSESYPLRVIPASPSVSCEQAGRVAEDAGNTVTSQSLSVPTAGVRRRSVSLGRTSSTFSRSFDDDDAQ